MRKVYSVLIVGAGKMGAFFDAPEDGHVFSHAHAFKNNDNFSIAGFVDPDLTKAQEASHCWGGKFFEDFGSAVKEIGKIDVVVVASPDGTHAKLFEEIYPYLPQVIVMEKPIGKTMEEIKHIKEICLNKKISVLVNYSRRFVKEFRLLREEISSGVYGAYVTGTGYYGKGVLHNGSHLTDFLRFLIGEIRQMKALSSVGDFYDDDPSVTARLSLEGGGDFLLQAIDARVATVFEMELFFQKARIKIHEAGFSIEKFRIADDVIFPGYKIFETQGNLLTSMDQALSEMVENINGHLSNKEALLCTVDDGHRAAEIALDLLTQVKGQ